ncbi:MAG: NAD(P)H-dependent flavin oxidoreductase [Lautropia sp.]
MTGIRERTASFCQRYGLRLPILLAPMAGACPPSLSIAVAEAGGLGACGALLLKPDEIAAWAAEFRGGSSGPFQINLWIPDPPPVRDARHEARLREFLAGWGPEVPAQAGDAPPIDFDSQCEALLAARPTIVSSIMGLYPPAYVDRLKAQRITWFATVTTVAEAIAAEAAGADVIVAQGMEAGGHRGAFDASQAETRLVGLFALLPAIVDAVRLPVVATGGIADARGVAAALMLGASAAQVGTGLLRSPEAKLAPAWAAALAGTRPEDTMVSRVFSGRPGRSIVTDYVRAATAAQAPKPAPYPVQRAFTAAMRTAAQRNGDVQRMQVWSGQSAAMAQAKPAAEIVHGLWNGAQALLG